MGALPVRVHRWYLHRTVLFLAVLAVAGAAWSAYASVSARHKLDPALRPALERRQPVNIWVELPFPPEEFHIRYLQEQGTVTGVRGRVIHLVRVRPGAAWAIARQYWVVRVWGEPGPQGHAVPRSIHVAVALRGTRSPAQRSTPHPDAAARPRGRDQVKEIAGGVA
jgi:hypothetical protein